MITKLTWNTETPPNKTKAIVVVKAEDEPNFITIAEYDAKEGNWFEIGGLNMQLGGYIVIMWTNLKQLSKLLKE
jgi:hypothetical protein